MEGFAVLPYYGPHISGFCRPLGLLANDPAAQRSRRNTSLLYRSGYLMRYHAAYLEVGVGHDAT